MSESNKTTGWEALALFLVLPFEVTLSGFVMTKLWSWFIVTTFGLAPLRIPQALGIGLTVHYLTSSTSDAKENHTAAQAIALATVTPLIVLLYGWLVHLFM